MLAMLMMRPQPFSFIAGSAANGVDDARWLTAMIASHFSTGNVSIRSTCWMPALLTRMSGQRRLRGGHEVGDLGRPGHVGGMTGDLHAALAGELAGQLVQRRALTQPFIITLQPAGEGACDRQTDSCWSTR